MVKPVDVYGVDIERGIVTVKCKWEKVRYRFVDSFRFTDVNNEHSCER